MTNENEEYSSTRVTRAKAAGLGSTVEEVKAAVAAHARKASTTISSSANAAGAQRKRAALGDVSNVAGKADVGDGGAKKALGPKIGGVAKAAQPTGIQKSTSVRAGIAGQSRTALAAKDAKKNEIVKRTGSGSSTIGAGGAVAQKRRGPASTVLEDARDESSEPLRKKPHTSDLKARARLDVKLEQEIKAQAAAAAAEQEGEVEEEPIHVVEPLRSAEERLIDEMDKDDMEDPLMVAEYAREIFDYLRDLEVKTIPNPNYMEHQDDIEWKTRAILIDWLVEVHTRFHLLPETLFLAVNIIDRFLSEKVVQLDRLQLVGITAMFIAAKYEEILAPHVGNFRHVADDGFTEREILMAERFVLSTLNYDLSYPNPMNFLRRISKADNYDIQTRTIAKYLMEISLMDHRFMEYRPSHIAAAAMFLSREILDRGEWDEVLAAYAGYTEEEILPVYSLMVDYLVRPMTHEAFFKKYANKKFLKASIVCRGWAKRNAHHFDIDRPDVPVDNLS